jgi:FkbM family methyltransferase
MYVSQIGQDKWVCEIYSNKEHGYFLDVGAYNGVTISNTFHLEKELGWTGICVEPLPTAFEELRANRSCICENVCVAPSSGTVHFRRRGKGSKIVPGPGKKIIECQAETLDVILARHKVPAIMEYFSLDIEGSELDVLTGFPFDKYSFGAITVEHNAYVGPEWQERREKMFTLLTSHGYVRHMEVAQDDWYIHPITLNTLLGKV